MAEADKAPNPVMDVVRYGKWQFGIVKAGETENIGIHAATIPVDMAIEYTRLTSAVSRLNAMCRPKYCSSAIWSVDAFRNAVITET